MSVGKLTSFIGSCRTAFQDAGVVDRGNGWIAAVERQPENPLRLHALAGAVWLSGRPDLWVAGTQIALELPHETPAALFVRACAKIRLGDWSGWQDYEARHDGPGSVTPVVPYARELRWMATSVDDLHALKDKTVLMIAEGGFGDSIQSMGFVPPLLALVGRLQLMVEPELVSLFEYNFGAVADIVSMRTPLFDDFDEYIWSSSVPRLFAGVPAFEPISAPKPMSGSSRNSASLHVGVCWEARVLESHVGVRRSITDLTVLQRVIGAFGTQWHSLQGGREEMAEALSVGIVCDLPTATFADTATAIAGLDCVVTVDTAVCHLAGRLGVPTFLLLPYAPDYRWGFGDRTPWYPSVRLIRQRRPGDWESAVDLLAGLIERRELPAWCTAEMRS
jgi:hypothetical protein